MGKIYVNQPFKIKTVITEDVNGVETPVDITGLPVVFNYVDPDGTAGTFTPAVLTDPVNGACEFDVLKDILTLSGSYTFWAVVTFANGDVPAEPQQLIIYEVGK